NARNCLPCLIGLLVLLGGALATWRRRRLAAGLTVALTLCGGAVSAALELAPALERPDFRDAVLALGRAGSATRALVLSPGADTVTLLYRADERPVPAPAAGSTVSEIDVVAADNHSSSDRIPSGFRRVATRDLG